VTVAEMPVASMKEKVDEGKRRRWRSLEDSFWMD
jgi:hypothetical protein